MVSIKTRLLSAVVMALLGGLLTGCVSSADSIAVSDVDPCNAYPRTISIEGDTNFEFPDSNGFVYESSVSISGSGNIFDVLETCETPPVPVGYRSLVIESEIKMPDANLTITKGVLTVDGKDYMVKIPKTATAQQDTLNEKYHAFSTELPNAVYGDAILTIEFGLNMDMVNEVEPVNVVMDFFIPISGGADLPTNSDTP